MKNRALWVVLLVLAIVSLLMVFVIMPRLNTSGDAAPAISAATDAVKSTADQAAATVETATTNIADAAAEKMDRLKAEAVKAVDGITALFADGRTPGVEAYSAAKTLSQGAVAALASIDAPEGLETKLSDTIKSLKTDAARALTMIEQLPDDPAKAASLVTSIKDALLGKLVETAAAPAQDASGSDVPRFDVLRVEPDGSTVIAGNAAPGAKVEILNGGAIISSQTVDGTGDFAAVLDNPLPPGDHSLQIRATSADGKMVTSEEVATISVPEGGKGELLAMVSKPGKASRLITLPGTDTAADAAAPAVAAEAQPAAATTTSAATAAAPVAALPDLPAASSELAGSAPVIPGTGTTVASAPAGQATSETPAVPSAAEVQVTAVEIEGDRIFVAGKAPAGSTVRGFADKAVIGEIKTDATGHFVIDGTMALSVGSHIIEVELLDATGKVVVRASVPFERPEGEQVSVVAPTPDASAAAASPEQAEFERLRVSLTKALTILEGLYANGQKPPLEQLAAARSATEFGLQSIIGFRAGTTASPEFTAAVSTLGTKAKEALALLQSVKTGDVDGLGAVLPKLVALIRELLDQPTPVAAVAVAPTADATTAPAAPASSADGSAAPKTIQQAPLAKSDNSVIIRRGDTLWQISRRVYGQGVRYTTIYLANENQIRNPDLIEPGQIFTVPKDALPNAEEIHRKRLRGEPVN
jgi:nucleoid-associated protein YgaU